MSSIVLHVHLAPIRLADLATKQNKDTSSIVCAYAAETARNMSLKVRVNLSQVAILMFFLQEQHMVNLFARVSIISSSNAVCGALRKRELAVVAVTCVS